VILPRGGPLLPGQMRYAQRRITLGRFGSVGRLRPRSKVWLESGGEVALSEWRVELLEAVEEHGSLSAAAQAMEVPFRTAWDRVKETEKRLGVKLLDTQSGGSGGGR